jgi:hypothetical protein
MAEDIYDDDENDLPKNIIYNLFNPVQLERHTYLEAEEIPIFNMLLSLGETNDRYQKKFMGKTESFECNLTKIAKRGLRLRTSRKGWRSEQVVKVAHSDFNKDEIQEEGGFQKLTKVLSKSK